MVFLCSMSNVNTRIMLLICLKSTRSDELNNRIKKILNKYKYKIQN